MGLRVIGLDRSMEEVQDLTKNNIYLETKEGINFDNLEKCKIPGAGKGEAEAAKRTVLEM